MNARSLFLALVSTFLGFPLAGQEPVGRIYHSMISTGPDEGIYVFGGVTEHRWVMDLLDVWVLEPAPMEWDSVGVLTPGDSYAAAFDSGSRRMIVHSLTGDTWAFDPEGASWEHQSPAISPSGRCGQRMVYDQESDRVILFGGFGCTAVDDPVQSDTWAYDYESDEWEEMNPSLSPPARMYHAMDYDPSTDETVLWGGRVDDAAVWSYDYESDHWTRHEPVGGPSGIRSYHTMTYEPTLDRFLVFGGLELDAPLSFEGSLQRDTWLLDIDQGLWQKVEAIQSPTPRSHHAAAYSPVLDQVVIYGGELEASYSGIMTGEVWTFDAEERTWILRR